VFEYEPRVASVPAGAASESDESVYISSESQAESQELADGMMDGASMEAADAQPAQ